MLAVVFGEEGGLPNRDGRILLFDPPEDLRVRFIIGPDDNDMMPYALAIYDLDGDGMLDIVPNAMGGDGLNNEWINAGEIYVISGAEFLSAGHVFMDETSEAMFTPTPRPSPTPFPDATAPATSGGNIATGRLHFVETCAGCHGFLGEGIPGLGLPLATSPLVIYAPDDELLAFLKVGRPSDHPDNVTGVTMPPSGGRPDWNDQDLLDIIAYLRRMRDSAPQ
jgi:mono/diheme cytochrome c family protein